MADVRDDELRIDLPAVLDAAAAVTLVERFRAASDVEAAVRLDAAAVTRVTTPAVQVLLAAGRDAAARGRRFACTGASETFTRAFADLGLAEALATWKDR